MAWPGSADGQYTNEQAARAACEADPKCRGISHKVPRAHERVAVCSLTIYLRYVLSIPTVVRVAVQRAHTTSGLPTQSHTSNSKIGNMLTLSAYMRSILPNSIEYNSFFVWRYFYSGKAGITIRMAARANAGVVPRLTRRGLARTRAHLQPWRRRVKLAKTSMDAVAFHTKTANTTRGYPTRLLLGTFPVGLLGCTTSTLARVSCCPLAKTACYVSRYALMFKPGVAYKNVLVAKIGSTGKVRVCPHGVCCIPRMCHDAIFAF